MTVNISEFERTKPVETLKLINDSINYYNSKINLNLTTSSDECAHDLYIEFNSKLLQIKSKLLNGE
jgi:hypothetical protein